MGAAALLLAALAAAQTAAPCPLQPMPSPLDSIGRPAIGGRVIAFAAVPSLDHRAAWALRLSRRRGGGTLEIIRLHRQHDCNRYEIGRRWEVALSQADYQSVVAEVAPFVTPAPGTVTGADPMGGLDELALDGVSLELRVLAGSYDLRREVNLYGKSGPALSAVFRKLAEHHLPAADRPGEDWRMPR